MNDTSVIFCDRMPKSLLREYIQKDKKYYKCVFLKKRKCFLFRKDEDAFFYKPSLRYQLLSGNKNKWREIIIEFEKIASDIMSDAVNLEDIENSPGFKSWENDILNHRKENRRKTVLAKKKIVLDGEIELRENILTTSIVKLKDIPNTFRNKIVVYLPIDSKYYKWIKFLDKTPNFKFYVIRKNDIKLISNFSNFINLEQFMQHKTFRKIATATRAIKLLDLIKNLDYYGKYDSFFDNLLTNKREKISNIREYVRENRFWGMDNEVRESIYSIALEKNLFDPKILSDVLEVENLIDDLKFLKYIKLDFSTPQYKKESMNIVYQLLKYRKQNKDDLENFDIIITLTPKEKKEEKEEEKELIINGI